jgi:lipopolysaccharide/colanic/teichoic acid biosynthesis glycosyltransferase
MYNLTKRISDVLFSLAGLILLSPILAAIALLIKITSPGTIFYRGVRTGIHGKPFRIFKFRTMVMDAEKIGGPSTAHNDERFTPIGKFLRKYKLDELPQLLNILWGDMSFVGPRPQVEKYTKLYQGEDLSILSVKPGLTDFASIKFINLDEILGDANVDDKYLKEVEPEKNKLRIKYVKERSFFVDLKLIFATLAKMIKRN